MLVLLREHGIRCRSLVRRPDEAIAELQIATRLDPFIAMRGSGWRARIGTERALIAKTSYSDALGFLGPGESARALDWFIRAADAHERPFYFGSPEFDPIRTLPRYPELLRKLNLHDQPVATLKAGGRS